MKFDDNYKYLAFISYAQDDVAYAKKLKRKLERSLRQKCFVSDVDSDGKTISDIFAEIPKAKFMICLCSSSYTLSEVCDREVNTFINDSNRKDPETKIIPLIMSSGGKATSIYLPRRLRSMKGTDAQPFAINESKYGKSESYQRLKARLNEVPFDVWKIARKKKKIAQIALLLIMTAIISYAGIIIWAKNHTFVKYYKDYVECYGIPVGLFELKNKKELPKRDRYYRFEIKDSKVRKVILCDSFGNPSCPKESEWSNRFPIQEFVYNSFGDIDILVKNQYNCIICRKSISPDKSLIDLKNTSSGYGESLTLSVSNNYNNIGFETGQFDLNSLANKKAQIRSISVEYDANGYVSQELFGSYPGSRKSAKDVNGIEGLSYYRDSLHRITEIVYIDRNGNKKADINGVAGKEYLYDDFGNLIFVRHKDINGQNKLNESYWAIRKASFDSHDRCTSVEYLGEDEMPIVTEGGYAKATVIISEDNLRRDIFYYDERGNNTATFDGVGISYHTRVITERNGRKNKIEYFDSTQSPIYNNGTCAQLIEFNETRNKVKCSYLDENENLASTINGVSFTDYSLDSEGHCYLEENFNKKGQYASPASLGIIKRKFINNKLCQELYFQTKDVPFIDSNNMNACGIDIQYKGDNEEHMIVSLLEAQLTNQTSAKSFDYSTESSLEYIHDEQGRLVQYARYDGKGNPKELWNQDYYKEVRNYEDTSSSYVSYMYKSDNSLIGKIKQTLGDNHLVKVEFFDCNENREADSSGVAMYRYEYDGVYPSKTRFYGRDLNPVINKSQGCYELRTKYEKGQLVELSCYDSIGCPMTFYGDKYFKKAFSYDAFGKLLKSIRYGLQGERVNDTEGICYELNEYDISGKKISHSYYDNLNNPVENSQGIFKVVWNYNKQFGTPEGEEFFNKSGHYTIGPGAYAKSRMYYDKEGNVYKWVMLDENQYVAKNTMLPPVLYIFSHLKTTVAYDQSGNKKVQIGNWLFEELRYNVTYDSESLQMTNQTTGCILNKYGEEKDAIVAEIESYIHSNISLWAKENNITLDYDNPDVTFHPKQ